MCRGKTFLSLTPRSNPPAEFLVPLGWTQSGTGIPAAWASLHANQYPEGSMPVTLFAHPRPMIMTTSRDRPLERIPRAIAVDSRSRGRGRSTLPIRPLRPGRAAIEGFFGQAVTVRCESPRISGRVLLALERDPGAVRSLEVIDAWGHTDEVPMIKVTSCQDICAQRELLA